MPTLVAKYQEKVTVAKVKKFYNIFSNAFAMAQAEDGDVNTWLSSDKTNNENIDIIVNKISPYLKISKTCGYDPGCFADDFKYLTGVIAPSSSQMNTRGTAYKFILDNGMPVEVGLTGADCKVIAQVNQDTATGRCGFLNIDVNGNSLPNTFGIDLFSFSFYADGVVPLATNNTMFKAGCKNGAVFQSGQYCSGWVIYNENLDYLHCDDLSWDGKTKCD